MPTKVFKSKAALRRNAAYVHIHNVPHRHIIKEVREPSGKIKITTGRKVWYNEAHQGLIALAVIAVAGLIGFHLYQKQKTTSSSQSSESPALSSLFGFLNPYENLPNTITQSSQTTNPIISTPTFSSPIVSNSSTSNSTTTNTSTSSGSGSGSSSGSVSTLPQQEPQGFEQGFAQHNMNIKQAQTSTTTTQTSSPVIVTQPSTAYTGPILASQISRILNFRR